MSFFRWGRINNDRRILTAIGKAKLASATSENQLEITHVAVGDGNGSYPVLTENMVALANEVWRGTASTPIHDTQAPNTLMFESAIPPDVGGFTIREIAVFDRSGAMIAIGHVDPAQQKPLPKQSTGIHMTVRIMIALANAAETNLFFVAWLTYDGLRLNFSAMPFKVR
ncbi:phage tail protein [Paenibacillus sp. HJGM_3]|uniref:phage tail protein n=1 Tax=Paenibacillus sp. HJGM_3 TaxID=3379816 RepID=UPI0038582620